MSKKIQTALWLIKLWMTTLMLFGTASALGGYLGYLAALKLTGQ